jgi:hypothetical protein
MKLEVGRKYKIAGKKQRNKDLADGIYVISSVASWSNTVSFGVVGDSKYAGVDDSPYIVDWYDFTPIHDFKAGDLVDVFVFPEKPEHQGVKLLFNNEHGFAVEVSTSCKRYFWKDTFTELRPHTPQPQLEIGAVYKAVNKTDANRWSVGIVKACDGECVILDPGSFAVNTTITRSLYTFTKLVEAK